MNTETALAHLEAFIAGGDELGDVSESDALAALEFVRHHIAWQASVIALAEQEIENEFHKLNEEMILLESDE